MEDERWLTVEELAERWRVNPETVRRWIRTRQIAALALGKKAGYRISEAEVLRFQQERMQERDDDHAEGEP